MSTSDDYDDTPARKSFTLAFKLDVLKTLESLDGNVSETARHHDVPGIYVSRWRAQKDKLLDTAPAGTPKSERASERSRIRENKAKYPELEEKLVAFVQNVRKRGLAVQTEVLTNKALEFFPTLYPDAAKDTFQASKGWTRRFMRRNGFIQRWVNGIDQEVPDNALPIDVAKRASGSAMSGGLGGLMKYRYQKKEEKRIPGSSPPPPAVTSPPSSSSSSGSSSVCNGEGSRTPETKKVTARIVPSTPDSGKPSPVFNSIKKIYTETASCSNGPSTTEKQTSSPWLSKESLIKRKLDISPPSQSTSQSSSSQQSSRMSSPARPLTDEDREILSLISSLQGVFPQKQRPELEKALDAADNNYDRAVNFLIDGRFVDYSQKKRPRQQSNNSDSSPVKPKYKRVRIISSDDDSMDAPANINGAAQSNHTDEPKSTSDLPNGTSSSPVSFLKEAFPTVPDATILNTLENFNNDVDRSLDALTELRSKQISQTKNVGSIKAMKEARDIAIAMGQTGTSPSPVKQTTSKHKLKSRKQQNGDGGSDDDWNDDDDDDDDDDDSSDEERGQRRHIGQAEVVLKFMNEASIADLLNIGGCSKKKAECLMELRPFDNWGDMVMKLDQCKSLSSSLVDECKELLRIRNNVQSLMKKCERISQDLEAVISELTDKTSLEGDDSNRDYIVKQPSILTETMQLTPYQLVGLNWLYIMHEQQLNGILGDEMGLGKTIQTIAFLAQLKEFGEEGPHLIIAPSSTLDNWLRELKIWCPSLNVMLYYGSQEDRHYLRQNISRGDYDQFDVAVTTYNMATGSVEDRNMFKKFNWHYAVFDEGHMLKNMTSIRYKTLNRINAERRLLLTGTPLQNNLIELMSLLAFVMPDLFTNKTEHLKRIFATMTGKSSGDNSRSAYETENVAHAKRILKPFFLRRLKTEVLKQLPKKKEKVEYVPMAYEQQELYESLTEEFTKTVSENVSVMSGGSGAAMMMQLRKAANHHLLHRRKYDVVTLRRMAKDMLKEPTHTESVEQYVYEDMEVMTDFELHRLSKQYRSLHKYQLDEELILESGKFRYLDDLLPSMKTNGSRVLLFSQFTMMLDVIEVYMTLRDYKYIRLDGQTNVADRQGLIDRYNNDDSIFVFLLSTRAGGLGINLTAANVVVLHDIDFNPYNDKQAEDRCHRLGQKRDVTVYRLLSAKSIEEGMWKCAQGKLKLEQDITGAGTGDVSIKDTASLLKETLNIHSSNKPTS